jgi:ubiquinone/menaquinone biosynthesis C-methylase UbiE
MSTSTATGAGPSPERIFSTILAYQQSAALNAGLDLGVFTRIGEGAGTAAEIAERTGASERGIRILCDYLAIIGFLTKDGSRYALTEESALFLDHRSPAYMGGVRHFLLGSMLYESAKNLTAVVRDGRTQLPGQGSVEPDNPIWVDFARSMVALMAPASRGIAEMLEPIAPRKVLDIAAGHGYFGIAVAQRYPEARIVPVDWAAVLEVARENARNAGVEDRFEPLAGDAFEVDFGTGYDVALVTNFFHHFDQPTCERLMRKIHASLRPGGICVTLEMVPNDDRITPPGPASFSLTMLASTVSGDAYTFAEYDRMFRAAGFGKSEQRQVAMSPEAVIVTERD